MDNGLDEFCRERASLASDLLCGRFEGLPLKSFGRAEVSAGGVATAQITFGNTLVRFVQKGTSKGAGSHTGHTLDANFVIEVDGSSPGISLEGVDQTRFNTGGVIALEANDRNPQILKAAFERINEALSQDTLNGVSEGTGQFAGAAAGTQIGGNDKAVRHG
jgi:hypothetical protein